MPLLLRHFAALALMALLFSMAQGALAQCPPLYLENFDFFRPPLLPNNWVASQGSNPTGAPLWVTSSVTPFTPPFDAFSTAPGDILDNRLDTPPFAAGSFGPFFAFASNYNLESGRDGAVLEVSAPNVNGGAFTDVTDPAINGFISPPYNSTISTSFQSPIAGRAAWSGNSGGWVGVFVNLNQLGQTNPGQIRLRFRLATDNNNASAGWRIDRFEDVGPECSSPTPTPTPSVTPTATATATAIATPCGEPNVIADSTFEAGSPWTDWTVQSSTNFDTPLCDTATCGTGNGTAPPYAGHNWAWFGGTNVPETATLGQTVVIPAGSQATLNFVMRVHSPNVATLKVKVDGTIVQTYQSGPTAYSPFMIDLSAFADGASHLILFEYISTNSFLTSFVVDNVTLNIGSVCQTPNPTPTVTATATATVPPTPCPGGAVLFQNFDGVTAPALPAGWTASNAIGPTPTWVTSTVQSLSSPNNAFVDEPSIISDKRLDTPNIPIMGEIAELAFESSFNFQNGFDGGVLEVSSPNINGGAFTDITDPAVGASFRLGGYNATISTAFMSPLAGRMAWSGTTNSYQHTNVDLGTNLFGQIVKFRFRMATDNNTSGAGWHIDEVRVLVYCTTPTPTPPTPTPTATATATVTATPFVTPCPNAGIFGETFDGVTAPALPAGWLASNAVGPPPLWVTSTITPYSPPNDAFIDDPATISDKRLDTPPIAISGANPQVSFRNFYNLENNFDGAVLEVSSPNINGGAFTDITDPAVGGSFVTGGYNATISTSFMSPIAGRMAWSGNFGEYVNTVANLGAVGGQFIKLRFRMASDSSGSGTGWRVDNIAVSVICEPPSPTPTPPSPSPTSSCPPVITQSTLQTITVGNSASCNNGVGHTDNSYWRAFNMTTLTGDTGYFVHSVSFGVESANQTQPVTVRLYANNGAPFPGGTRTQLATTTVDVASFQNGTVVQIPLNAAVAAGTGELVMELFTPDGQAAGNLFLVGSNTGTETGPSYLSAPACGVTTPITTGALGFPDMHIVFNIHGTCDCEPQCTATPTATATATATASPTPTSTPTATPTATLFPTPSPPAISLNLSTRMLVQTDDRVGIGGFIIAGTGQILLRAIGPSLVKFGVPNPLEDPVMELHGPAGFTTIINDNWRDTQEAEIAATGLSPISDLESAILATVEPGAYTAVVKGRNNMTGVALVEVYNLSGGLGNISTRAFVGTADDVMIGGFILGHGSNTNIVIRGIGPSLSSFGIPDPLADPTLELRDTNGALIAANDDCGKSALPVPSPESCIDISVPAGSYTAILAGKDGGTGVALVEIYNVH